MPVFRTLLALLVCAAFARAEHELRTLDGQTVKGKIVAVTATEVVQQGTSGTIKTPLARVLSIDLRAPGKAPEAKHTLVRLADDSQLLCSDVTLKGKTAELTLLNGPTVKVPVASLTVVMKDAQDPQVRAQWDKFLAKKVKRDRLILGKDGTLNEFEGTFGEVDAEGKEIQFLGETGLKLKPSLQKAKGLIFFQTDPLPQTAVCVVYDTHGNSLAASEVSVNGNAFTVKTPAGLTMPVEEKVLARLDYNRGKLTFLSDLDPTKVVERSGAGLVSRYRKDANLDGEQPILLANDKSAAQFTKGLSMHAYTELEYDLDGKYKDFKAVLGVDARTGSESQAELTILCDGQKMLTKSVSAKAVQPIAVNVRNVRKLKIIVSSQNVLDLYDHATLAEARVSQ
jgi:hypothetical protein